MAISHPNTADHRPDTEKMLDRAAIQDWLVARVAEILEVPRDAIDSGTPFIGYGLESLDAYTIAGDLATWLDRELSATLLWEYPDIESLAAFLAEGAQVEWKSLMAIQPQGTRPPFFVIHNVAGSLFSYYDLARCLGEDQPVYGFQGPQQDDIENRQSLFKMSARYVEELREFQPEGPYFLGGASFSGMVAFEMARQLKEAGCEIGLVVLFDSYCPKYAESRELDQRISLHTRLNQRISRFSVYMRYVSSLTPQEKYLYLRERSSRPIKWVRKKSARRQERAAKRAAPNLQQDTPESFHNIKQDHQEAVKAYIPPIYPGKITLFRAEDKYATGTDPYLGWQRVAQEGVEVHDVPGDHHTLMKQPHVRVLAQHLVRCLDRAQGHEA